MYRLKKVFVVGFFAIFGVRAAAQVDYPIFKNETNIEPADSQKLSLLFYNLNYLHNTEWFTNIPLSGTHFGYQIIPQLQYQISPEFILKGGIYLQQEFGRQRLTTVAPVFTAKYQTRYSSFLLGAIEGGASHRFIEPLYDYAWMIKERIENGLQIKVDTRLYWQDLYINWRVAIHPDDPFKEEFDMGYSAQFNLMKNEKWKVTIPLQVIGAHKGGQYDLTNEPLTSLVNSAIGLSLSHKPPSGKLSKIKLDNYYVNYRDISGNKRQPFNTGNGFLSHLLFGFKNIGIDLRYWKSKNYITPRGLALFGSISEKYPGLTEPDRELVILSLIYDKEIAKNLFLNFRFIPYKDLAEKMTSGSGIEYSYELYLKYVMKVDLGKIRNTLP